MQNNDKMHPDDMRNLILFGIISIVLWFSYDHFILKPKLEKMRAAQEIAQEMAVEAQVQSGMTDDAERPRTEIISENRRVSIKSDKVFGSINLTGARLDDLELEDYYKTVEREEHVSLLSPTGSMHPKYIEHGWVSSDTNLKLPNAKSVWKIKAGDVLTPNSPVTLQWKNGRGLTFEQVISIDDTYAFSVTRRVLNNTRSAVTLYPFSLIAQRGIPEDFMGRWVVHEGPIGYFGDKLFEETFGKMEKDPTITETATKGWIGLTSKNWHTALVPEQESETKFRITYTKAVVETAKDRYQADIMGPALVAQSGSMIEYKTNFFAGAKKMALLEKYEDQWNIPHFDLAIDFGWFYFLTRPFFFVINFLFGLVGNFGVAIILFTVMLRICVFPLANTSFKSFAKMRVIGPKMTELREKYKDDKPQLQKELVKLYQKEKVNPMAGCLPIVVQIPIFFSLFKVLSNTIETRHAPFFGWIEDLSAPDPTSIFNLFGLLPFDPPSMLMIGAWPCMMLITMIIQRKLSPPPTDKFQAQMIAAMPWFMTYILAQFASGLVIYWTFNNLLSVIQQYIIMRSMGVEIDLIGNILGRNKPVVESDADKEKAKLEKLEKNVEAVVKKGTKKAAVKKTISKPKPKKKSPTQKKKK